MSIDPEQLKQLLLFMSADDVEQMLIVDGFNIIAIRTAFNHIFSEKSDSSIQKLYQHIPSKQSSIFEFSNKTIPMESVDVQAHNTTINSIKHDDYCNICTNDSDNFSGTSNNSMSSSICQRIFRIQTRLSIDIVRRLLHDFLQLPSYSDLMAEFVGDLRYINNIDDYYDQYTNSDDHVDCIAISIKSQENQSAANHFPSSNLSDGSRNTSSHVIEFKLIGMKDSLNQIHIFFPSYLLQAESQSAQLTLTTMNEYVDGYETLSVGKPSTSGSASSDNYAQRNDDEESGHQDDGVYHSCFEDDSIDLTKTTGEVEQLSSSSVYSRQLEIPLLVLQYLYSRSAAGIATALTRCVESLREQLPPAVTVSCVEVGSNDNYNQMIGGCRNNNTGGVILILESSSKEYLETGYIIAQSLFCPAIDEDSHSKRSNNVKELSQRLQHNLLQLLSPRRFSYVLTINDKDSCNGNATSVEHTLLQNQRRICKYLERLFNVSIRIQRQQEQHKRHMKNNTLQSTNGSSSSAIIRLEIYHIDSEAVLQVAVLELTHLLSPISVLEAHLREREQSNKIHVFVDISNIEIGAKMVCSLCRNKMSSTTSSSDNKENNSSNRLCPCHHNSISRNHQNSSHHSNNNSNFYMDNQIQLDVAALVDVIANMRSVVRKIAVGSYSHHHSRATSLPVTSKHHGTKKNDTITSHAKSGFRDHNNRSNSCATAATVTHHRWSDAGFSVLEAARNLEGREQLVDETLHAHILSDVNKCFPDTRTLVILTGDGNNNNSSTSFPEVIQQALSHAKGGWRVEVWGWRRGVSNIYYEFAKIYPTHFSLFLLDTFREEILVESSDAY